MMIRLQFLPNTTVISERSSESEMWREVLNGDSNNITKIAEQILERTSLVVDQYFNGEGFIEEYILSDFAPRYTEPNLMGMSRYALAKFAEISDKVA